MGEFSWSRLTSLGETYTQHLVSVSQMFYSLDQCMSFNSLLVKHTQNTWLLCFTNVLNMGLMCEF